MRPIKEDQGKLGLTLPPEAPASAAPRSATPRVSRRYSLRWRLPILISGLIAAVLATFLWAAFRRAQQTLIDNAGDRAQLAAGQVTGLLDGQRSIDRINQVAADPAVRHFVETGDDGAGQALRARLTAASGTAPRRIEIWNNSGVRLLEVTAEGATAGAQASRIPPPGAPPSAIGMSPLQGTADLVFMDIIAEIPEHAAAGSAGSKPRAGYLRMRATFVESPPGIFSRLVGRGAAVRIGNRTGGTWTDFGHLTPTPPIDLSRPGIQQYEDANGERRVGAVALIPATPWAAWVEFPLSDVVAPARTFLNAMVIVLVAFVAAAAVIATMLASRITTPVAELNVAAAALARGDYARRVSATRRDEIGELARTFNAMAADIESTSAALKQSEDSYRRLFSSNPNPMWLYDIETLRFLDVNDMAVAHYGYSREEFRAMTIKDIRPESELPVLLDNLSHDAPRMERSGVWTHRLKDGTLIDVEITSHELHVNGRQARAVLAHDVTERIRAQQALYDLNADLEQRVKTRTADLEAANQELEAFSYSVSHDLRAPLRHVQGYVEMLTAASGGTLSERSQRYLQTITDATVEMGELIDDLLAFSRIGRVQMSEGRVSLDEIVHDSIRRLEMATRDRHIAWTIDPLPDVIGDPSLLKQVFANLLGNAVKYSRDRDPARIHVGCSGEEDGGIVLFVRDNGAGFDMQYAHKLFGVFQRLHRSDEFEGTGIGLATVRRIVSRHGGRTWAEGKLNEGATIYFVLKQAAREEAAAPRTS